MVDRRSATPTWFAISTRAVDAIVNGAATRYDSSDPCAESPGWDAALPFQSASSRPVHIGGHTGYSLRERDINVVEADPLPIRVKIGPTPRCLLADEANSWAAR